MSKNRTRLFQLGIILLLLLILLYVKNTIPNLMKQKPQQPFVNIKKDQINEIQIINDKNSTTIIKKGNLWQVKKGKINFTADQDRINTLIDNFLSIKKDNIVSTNKNKQKDFGIDKKKIEIKINNKVLALFVGDAASSSKSYVRIDNEDEVFTSTGFDSVFYPEDYRDLFVHAIENQTKVTTFSISFDNEKLNAIKNGEEWKVNETVAKKDRVDFFLNDLKNLKGNDVLSDTKLTASPELSINITEDKNQNNIKFYPKDKENYYAATTKSKQVFQIASANVDALKKTKKDFTE